MRIAAFTEQCSEFGAEFAFCTVLFDGCQAVETVGDAFATGLQPEFRFRLPRREWRGAGMSEYIDKIMSTKMPDEVREKLLKEADRLSKTPFGSAEATVTRNYLDTCLEIPWSISTKDRIDIAAAKKILDADHDGLDKVKERILEYLAVKQLNPELGNQILCLVGPPGVGKTSVGASIAKAMKRKYVRVSLGGVRDEADIRGHRKTYIGAMPGRII